MKIEYGINPNCSEAVFRFYTLDPKQIQLILQAIADEINANTDFKPHQNQKIPLFKTAREYDTKYKRGQMLYYGSVRKKDDKKITQQEAVERYDEIQKKMSKEIYPKVLLKDCAGLGDNEAAITIELKRKAFRLNIGNNDISSDKTGWTDKIKALRIKVEEAEFSKDLSKHARDCTCGITYFEGYENLIKDK